MSGIKRTLETRKLDKLKNHRFNAEVFGELMPDLNQDDSEFIESVKQFGVLIPLTVCPDETIISGHRRRQAAARAGLKEVPVIVLRHIKTQVDVDRAWSESNRNREMTVEQRARLYQKRKEIEESAAKDRQKQSPGRGKKVGEISTTFSGKASDVAAAEVGMSSKTAEKASAVVQKIDEAERNGDSETASALRETLNTKSVSAAHRQATETAEPTESVIADSLKRAVPKALREQHDTASSIKSAASKLDAVKRTVKELSETPGGCFLQVSEIEQMVKELKGKISQSRYFTDCPKCKGRSSDNCKRCSGAKFIPFRMRGILSADEKEWLGIE